MATAVHPENSPQSQTLPPTHTRLRGRVGLGDRDGASVGVCACVRMRVEVCVYACVCTCVHGWYACVYVCACRWGMGGWDRSCAQRLRMRKKCLHKASAGVFAGDAGFQPSFSFVVESVDG